MAHLEVARSETDEKAGMIRLFFDDKQHWYVVVCEIKFKLNE